MAENTSREDGNVVVASNYDGYKSSEVLFILA